jgi:hypothetical protein
MKRTVLLADEYAREIQSQLLAFAGAFSEANGDGSTPPLVDSNSAVHVRKDTCFAIRSHMLRLAHVVDCGLRFLAESWVIDRISRCLRKFRNVQS